MADPETGIRPGGLLNITAEVSAIYDFESGNVDSWDQVNDLTADTTRVYNGTYAGLCDAAQTTYQAKAFPYTSEEQPNSFTFFWNEVSNSFGGGLRLYNSNGNDEVGFATDNPQWIVWDTNGATEVYSGDGVDRWIKVEFTFDWPNNSFDIFVEDLQSGSTFSDSGRPLRHGNGVLELWLEDYTGGTWGDGGSIRMWFDDLELLSPITAFDDPGTDTGLANVTFFPTNVDDFEDGNMDEYTGPATVTTTSYEGTYGATTEDFSPSTYSLPGDGLRTYPDEGTEITGFVRYAGYNSYLLFGVEDDGSGGFDGSYAVGMTGNGDFAIGEVSSGGSQGQLATGGTPTTDKWYKVIVDYRNSDSSTIVAEFIDPTDGSSVIELDTIDSQYAGSGVGMRGNGTGQVDKISFKG